MCKTTHSPLVSIADDGLNSLCPSAVSRFANLIICGLKMLSPSMKVETRRFPYASRAAALHFDIRTHNFLFLYNGLEALFLFSICIAIFTGTHASFCILYKMPSCHPNVVLFGVIFLCLSLFLSLNFSRLYFQVTFKRGKEEGKRDRTRVEVDKPEGKQRNLGRQVERKNEY